MTSCKHITDAEAVKLAKLAAENFGIDRSDVRDVDISDYDCSIHFEEKNVWAPNTQYRLVLEDSKWRLERKVKFLFGGLPLLWSCGADVAGSGAYDNVGVTLPDTGSDNGVTGKDNARIDNSSSCNDTDGGILSKVPGTVSYLKDGNWDDTADVCKTPQILLEKSCAGYVGEDTTETLLTTFIFCDCEKDRCVDEPLNLCKDPLPDEPPAGGTVWEWGTGNVVLDFCADETSVRHITCDEDGMEKQDITPCSEGVTCDNGMCGGIGCYDDDPQNDPFKKGEVEVEFDTGYSIDDDCESPVEVTQYNCPSTIQSGSDVFETLYNDAIISACPEGTVCDGGACVPKDDLTPECPKECQDNDPNQDPFKKGMLTFVCAGSDLVIEEHKDDCSYEPLSADGEIKLNKTVEQYFCKEDSLHGFDSSEYECPSNSFCYGGTCVFYDKLSSCGDDDNGYDIYAGGHSYIEIYYEGKKVAPQIYTEYCDEDNVVVELYCASEDGPILYEKVPCPSDTFCFAGACRTCTDVIDPEDDPTIFGRSVDIYGQEHSDYCVGDKVVQVFCNDEGNVDAHDPIPCASGKCDKGVCK